MKKRNTFRVLIADPLARPGINLLRRHALVVEAEDDVSFHALLPESDALVVRSRTRVTAELLALGSNLRIVGRAGVGIDNVDVDAATERGVLVVNAPIGNIRSTAEHAIGLLFALARRLISADAAVRAGKWKSGYRGDQIAGKRLGVVGLGKVGRQVASIAIGLNMDVVAFDPFLTPASWAAPEVELCTLHELLRTSDFVTIHVPKSTGTMSLIGVREIALMKEGAFLINCSRGGIVDEVALASALHDGWVAGAALDVFDQEPPIGSPLLDAPNTILTPHIAASTVEAQTQVSLEIATEIIDFFAGRAVSHPVNSVAFTRA